MPDGITIIQLLLTVGVIIGVYKNKIDNTGKLENEYRNLSERIARLEEKVNLILYTIKMRKDEN